MKNTLRRIALTQTAFTDQLVTEAATLISLKGALKELQSAVGLLAATEQTTAIKLLMLGYSVALTHAAENARELLDAS